MNNIREIAKSLLFRHTTIGKPTYGYQLEPIQLAEIVLGIEAVMQGRTSQATIVEIGVARGMTSRFIAEHIRASGYDVRFFCIDTFSSFTDEDLRHEETHRGKSRKDMSWFTYNDYAAWKRNFAGYDFVRPIQADAGRFDYRSIGPIDFCFLDVDLYRPTLSALEGLWPNMADRSILMVDDVNEHDPLWDGAHEAFMQFATERQLPFRVAGSQHGVLWKSTDTGKEPSRGYNAGRLAA